MGEGSPTNRHRFADQWLFVLSGVGRARVNGKAVPLKAGTLLLIEHKDHHEVRCTGRAPLRTLNFYVPPGYSKQANELGAAKP
jgi:mannose-6-phosphate isomerase-like protein (cupin superfamily)